MSKIEILSKKISEIGDFHKFLQVSYTEQRSKFAILSDYKGQSYVIVREGETTFTIKTNEVETTINRDDTKIFHVSNAQKIIFVPVDGKKGLLSFIDSYCDAIIFDEKDFCFLEFKLNASSLKKVAQNRVKAISQLSNTIDLFDEKLDRNYEGLHLEAYIATPLMYPRNDASWKKLAVEFLEKYGIPIFETNEKICKS